MIALFCGSRSWKDGVSIREVLINLKCQGLYCIIEGAAPGADSLAADEAKKLGIHVIEVPADWHILRNAAGPERNSRMLSLLLSYQRAWGLPIRCIAFHEDPVLGSGTRDMVDKCISNQVECQAVISADLKITESQGCKCGCLPDYHPSLFYFPEARLLCDGSGYMSR